jgi:large subunit ribosomal protein L4
MPTVDVINLDNTKVGSLDLAEEVFAVEVNEDLLYESVRHYRAGLRSGLAATKTRHEVAGSGKKLWKQKGTGRARMGSIRSPLWRHGGTTHGPQPRDYSYRLNKKMILGALRSALTAKLRDGELKVVDAFSLADHKTKNFQAKLAKLEAPNTVLLVDSGENRNLSLGARNIPGVKLVTPREVTTYDVLRHKAVLVSKSAAEKLSESLAASAKGAPK